MFTLIFGVTVLAASTVISSFMMGLALGAVYFGRLIDRYKNGFKLFAYINALIRK